MVEIRKSIRAQLDAQKNEPRPILLADVFPSSAAREDGLWKAYYHVVFKPWLGEPVTALSPWFLGVSLTEEPAFPNAAAIEAIVGDIEAVATGRSPSDGADTNIDAIFLGFHYDDHTHKASLSQFDRRIPVFATPEVSAMIKPWDHFETVTLLHDFSADTKNWQVPGLHPGEPLPPWLTILRQQGHATLHFCTAIVWSHVDSGKEIHEALMISPHGIRLYDGPLQAFLEAEPRTKTLAMMRALKEAYAYGTLQNFGVKGGLALYRRLGGARYWVLSHHQTLSYTGCFMRVINTHDVERTFEWGLDEEMKEATAEGREGLTRPNLVNVKNGSCFVLS